MGVQPKINEPQTYRFIGGREVAVTGRWGDCLAVLWVYGYQIRGTYGGEHLNYRDLKMLRHAASALYDFISCQASLGSLLSSMETSQYQFFIS